MLTATITIGTTPAKLLDLLRGQGSYAGASSSKTYAGMELGNGAQMLNLQAQAANSGTIYIGRDSNVSANNCMAELLNGTGFFDENGSKRNTIPLNIWIVGSAAGQKLNVGVRYQ